MSETPEYGGDTVALVDRPGEANGQADVKCRAGCGRTLAPSLVKAGNVTCETCRRLAKADGRKLRVSKRGPARATTARKAAPSSSSRKAPAPVDYRPGIEGLAQLICVPLAFTQPLDAAAVGMHTPTIAAALNNLAHERPEVAAVLDKVLAVGPYGELVGALLGLGAQLAVNHSMIPDQLAGNLGAIPREALEAELARRGEDMAAQAA